jgi:hypothetical protein
MNTRPRSRDVLLWTAMAIGLAGCGGGEIGGTVSGLGAGLSVTLLNNGTDSLTVAANGSFAFADGLDANAAYAVTVKTPPVGQSCTVANATGTLNAQADSIDDVRVSCAFLASLRGSVSGMQSGAALTLGNGDARLALAGNGPFAFADILDDGTNFRVVVITQPLVGNCTVRNGVGTFVASTFENIDVSCD